MPDQTLVKIPAKTSTGITLAIVMPSSAAAFMFRAATDGVTDDDSHRFQGDSFWVSLLQSLAKALVQAYPSCGGKDLCLSHCYCCRVKAVFLWVEMGP